MATFASAWQLGVAAMDELADIPGSGLTRLSVLLAGASSITQVQYDAVVAERDARQAAIFIIKANANARKAADAANVDGQADLDALAAF